MKAFFRTVLACLTAIVLVFVLFFLFLVGLAAVGKDEVSIKDNSVLVVELKQDITEQPLKNPLADIPFIGGKFEPPISLKDILDNIRFAKDDDHIKGLYIKMDIFEPGLATLDEIRDAIMDFKTSGKFVYAYGEIYTQKGYYVASVADKIFVNPNGVFGFAGFHSEQVFLKGLFEKLEIKPKLIRASDNRYKSAGEMFINKEMSPANREQLTAYINSAYASYLSQIGAARKIDTATLRSLANNLTVKYPEDAVKYKLADDTAYYDEVLSDIRGRLKLKEKEKINWVEMDEYKRAEHERPLGKDGKIALIYGVGDIMSGEGSESQIGSEKLSEAIRKAAEDDKIKAIVLRINSPGGSALASDVIWREVKNAKSKKPVIASFGDLAASGGYYIAAPADMIYSEPSTITGSIGVFGFLPMMKDFWEKKLGITFDRVKTGKYADLGNINREMTTEEESIIQQYVDKTYGEFIERVASGRHMDTAKVRSLAMGRIYSGVQAKELGLVDAIGSLDDAIKEAAKRAKIEKYSIKVMPSYKADLFKMLRNQSDDKEEMLKAQLGFATWNAIERAARVQSMDGILMYMPYEISVY
jgi:protease IV